MSYQRWVAIGCSHGNEVDQAAWDWAMSFIDDYKPHVVIHLGDAFEFKALRKGATNEEVACSIEEDIQCGLEHLKELASKAYQKHFLLGNHCCRLWEMMESYDGVRSDYARRIVEDITAKVGSYGYELPLKPYDSRAGILEINGVLFQHGYSHALHADKQLTDKYKRPVVFAHTHRALLKPYEGYPEPCWALNVGCLRDLNPHFASRGTSRLGWTHGLGYGTFNDNGKARLKLQLR